ncbi:hypothetical protein FNL08_09315 [Staphylococcus hominis]|uniref:hypothetical protein n=1 Tax=Staphylococcus hominis TaxID=1290 RepID=UPI00115CA6C6|nr:hypothetical protein [Staphylococcus hominis]TRL62263.1 hypothetical protein FNL08_09315 [Staphylococcus hominis]
MNIEFLQKLDFLLSIINNHSQSKSYKILFQLKGNTYTGSFLPVEISGKRTDKKLFYLEVKDLTKVSEIDFDYIPVCDVHTKNITLNNASDFKKIFFTQQDQKHSTYLDLIKISSNFESHYYFQALNNILEKCSPEFSDSLPSMIYNVENIHTKEKFSFLYIDKDTPFDFISIIPEDELQN